MVIAVRLETAIMAFFEQTKQPEAKQRCQDKGGQLATIHSKEENDLIYRLIRDPNPTFLYSSDWMYFAHSWIGLERASDGGFRWPDGSPTDYTNWGSSEPSNFEGLENCAHNGCEILSPYPVCSMVYAYDCYRGSALKNLGIHSV
ncbi:unnamed protein product [Nippostrongylus brasiliensis]|uniref:C-type lectin domain-containing protein n=1 Tax=Nippostrongylus brasiliensis TaxID=27835 RepID=A0A0N4XNK2_NIPBR|nr:unnamed protein product [Nippostrongylus brasiliensis]